MGNINILDCTMRDGGYINDWNFGEEAIKEIGKRIISSGVEYFEIGFMRDVTYNPDKTLFPGNEEIAKIIAPKDPNVKYFGMLDVGNPLPLEKLGDRRDDALDGIRVIFKKSKIKEGYDYCEKLIKMGYDVFAQFVGTDEYTDIELVETVQKFNSLDVVGVAIVDTFGLIKRKEFMRMVSIIDHNLRPGLAIGYHSHNNLQQAAGNAQTLAEMNLNRDIVIDGCVFGMGRGAGNVNLELYLQYMNENFGKSYRIEPLLEIIDEYLNEIYQKEFWGYSLPFYLSATNGCHPNYAKYFAGKGTLTVKAFNEILRSIPKGVKEIYSDESAEEIYSHFQENLVDDKVDIEKLRGEFSGRKILVLGSGKSITKQSSDIKSFIEENHPIVVGLNYCPEEYPVDYVFSCHMRRYSKLEELDSVKKIITSNIRDARNYDYRLNFSSYRMSDVDLMDNSGLVFIRVLIELGIKELYLAGMDGYDVNAEKNYVNSGLEYGFSKEMKVIRNEKITEQLREFGNNITINFLTESMYA